MKWRNWLNALFGVWFVISPWALGFSSHQGALWTTLIIGIIQVIVAAWAASVENSSGWKVWQTWVSLLTGIWFIIAPFTLSLSSMHSEVWTSVILGIVTAVLSLWTMGRQEETI